MQTLRSLISWHPSLVKGLICLCLGWAAPAAAVADEPPQQMTTEQLEDLLMPPVGWKLDMKLLSTHFWHTQDLSDEILQEPNLIYYPFWPAFFELVVQDGHVKERYMRDGEYFLGGLISDALTSPDPVIKKRSALWLRQNLVLYFAGFRLSKINGQRPYAPWIKPEDARRLDRMADEYVAAQKEIRVGRDNLEIDAKQMISWILRPRSTALTDVVSYYDMMQASDASIAVDHIYPIRWIWSRRKGNQKMQSHTSIDYDVGNQYSDWLLPSSLPDSTDPVCFWLRDVMLSYIAGKELLEGKHLQLEDKEDEPHLKEALQQWWAELERQK